MGAAALITCSDEDWIVLVRGECSNLAATVAALGLGLRTLTQAAILAPD